MNKAVNSVAKVQAKEKDCNDEEHFSERNSLLAIGPTKSHLRSSIQQ